ncbi:hypothetical protein HN789_02085 [archaeon]|nr:hypothetical protein [archaeon]MBT4021850.1 hypothetical protein [archaeon]MBT4272145.1 hypothetical protein [archaeon]MBT4460326.1 hypothetical protein [archaeon]MBT4858950.1 hypothetical protein [archaeon]
MVEIKVDTSKASRQDIKRAIEFLKNYLDEPLTNDTNDMDVPVGAMNIFGSDPSSSSNENKEETISEKKDPDLQIKPIFY